MSRRSKKPKAQPAWRVEFDERWPTIEGCLEGTRQQKNSFRVELAQAIEFTLDEAAAAEDRAARGLIGGRDEIRRACQLQKESLELIDSLEGYHRTAFEVEVCLRARSSLFVEQFDADRQVARARHHVNLWHAALEAAEQREAPRGPTPRYREQRLIAWVALAADRHGVVTKWTLGLRSPIIEICQAVLPLVGYLRNDVRRLVKKTFEKYELQAHNSARKMAK